MLCATPDFWAARTAPERSAIRTEGTVVSVQDAPAGNLDGASKPATPSPARAGRCIRGLIET